MQLSNPFSTETRLLFFDGFAFPCCSRCGANGNHGLELHHIWGRCSSSPFNASVLCHTCHEKIGQNQKTRLDLFLITYQYLQSVRYRITKNDEAFLLSVGNELRHISHML